MGFKKEGESLDDFGYDRCNAKEDGGGDEHELVFDHVEDIGRGYKVGC